MTALNQILGRLFDGLFRLLGGLPPLAGLALVSLLVAVATLLLIRATSNQERIAGAKRQMLAGLFEIRLFNDDLRTILQAQGSILRHNLAYLRLTMVPMLCMIAPLALFIAQLQSFYGYRAVRPGETFLVKLQLPQDRGAAAQRHPPRPEVELRVPAGLELETADVWVPALSEVSWRVRAERRGRFALEVRLGRESLAKEVLVADGLGRLSPVRLRPGFPDQLLYPAESPLPRSSDVQRIQVTYAARGIPLLGWEPHWMVPFFAFVIAFAWVLRGRFRVAV